ncbi:MAG: GtrA family protein [Bacteroidales bacterium]|nr:GtrA family protein [Bacteroidales bacterium]
MLKGIRDIIIAVADWFYKPFGRFIPQTVFRYGFTGGLNTLFDIILYYIFYNFIFKQVNFDLGFVVISPHIAAFLAVFPITFATGFLLAKYVTFTQSTLKGSSQFFRYALSVMGSILLNYLFLKLFNEVVFVGMENIELRAMLSKVITTGLVIIYSYFMQMYFSFSQRKRENKN